VLLNGRHQFHRVVTDANAELLGGIRMVVCHCCWDEWVKCGRVFRPHQQSGTAFLQAGCGVNCSAVTGILMVTCGFCWS
jgi:hypothetical protein